MNKFIFSLLLVMLSVGLLFPSPNLALLLAFLKVLLVVFFYMELRSAHIVWKLIVTSLITVTFSGLYLYV